MKNNDNNLKDLLIIGAGAIGGITAAKLYEKGVDVTLLTEKDENFEAIKNKGVIVNGEKGITVPIFPTPATNIKHKFKHIIVAVKNPQTEIVMKNIDTLITDETLVYSFQNGLGNTEIMARYIPEEQIVAVVIGWGATNLGPGRFKVTSSSGNFVIGFEKSVTQKQQSKLHEMKKMLKCWKPTIITDKIKDYRWAKLIVNSIIAPLGALLGITVGEMFEHVKTRKIMTELKQEALLLVNKLDISLEKVDGIDIQNFFYRPQPQDGFFKRIRRPLMSRIINYIGARRHGNIRSSMLTDLKHDKKTEIDYLNGVLVGKASEINLELPLNAFILKAIKEIEAGKRVVGLHNLVELEKFAEISYDKTSQYFGKNR